MRALDIAVIGTRGLPATFGGVERHVEEIGSRLAAGGHRVTVYSERGYGLEEQTTYRGMHIVPVPAVHRRSLEAISHAARSTARSIGSRPDVMHFHAIGPGLMTPLARTFSRSAVVQTIHGLDAERAKWGRAARTLLRTGTWLSAHVPHTTITVSETLRRHYDDAYGRASVAIPNGVTPAPRRPPRLITESLGLHGDDYVLFVGRLVPEKRPELLVRAFADVDTSRRLVVVGGSSYTDDYVEELRALAARDPRVVMPGYVYGEQLEELFSNAAVFVQPSDLEGLPITLLEAVGAGRAVLASDIGPHLDVLGSDQPGARLFRRGDVSDLTRALQAMVADPASERDAGAATRERVLAAHDWDRCAEHTEAVYREALGRVARGPRR